MKASKQPVAASTASNPDKAKTRAERTIKLKCPTSEDWTEIVRDLKLNDEQAGTLKDTTEFTIEGINSYYELKSRQPDRADLVARLKRLEKALGRVVYECSGSAEMLEFLLPSDLLQYLGRSLTFSAMGEAVGTDVFPQYFDVQAGGVSVSLASLEQHTRQRRENLGLKHGHLILGHVVRQLHAPLRTWVELDRLNKGGRTPDAARACLIQRLAEVAPAIIGQPASISSAGPFVELCSAVLPRCGISEKGIDKAIPAIVKRMRADQVKQS